MTHCGMISSGNGQRGRRQAVSSPTTVSSPCLCCCSSSSCSTASDYTPYQHIEHSGCPTLLQDSSTSPPASPFPSLPGGNEILHFTPPFRDSALKDLLREGRNTIPTIDGSARLDPPTRTDLQVILSPFLNRDGRKTRQSHKTASFLIQTEHLRARRSVDLRTPSPSLHHRRSLTGPDYFVAPPSFNRDSIMSGKHLSDSGYDSTDSRSETSRSSSSSSTRFLHLPTFPNMKHRPSLVPLLRGSPKTVQRPRGILTFFLAAFVLLMVSSELVNREGAAARILHLQRDVRNFKAKNAGPSRQAQWDYYLQPGTLQTDLEAELPYRARFVPQSSVSELAALGYTGLESGLELGDGFDEYHKYIKNGAFPKSRCSSDTGLNQVRHCLVEERENLVELTTTSTSTICRGAARLPAEQDCPHDRRQRGPYGSLVHLRPDLWGSLDMAQLAHQEQGPRTRHRGRVLL